MYFVPHASIHSYVSNIFCGAGACLCDCVWVCICFLWVIAVRPFLLATSPGLRSDQDGEYSKSVRACALTCMHVCVRGLMDATDHGCWIALWRASSAKSYHINRHACVRARTHTNTQTQKNTPPLMNGWTNEGQDDERWLESSLWRVISFLYHSLCASMCVGTCANLAT